MTIPVGIALVLAFFAGFAYFSRRFMGDLSSSLRAEVVYLQQQAPFFASERAVRDVRGPAGVSVRPKSLPAHGQISSYLEDLLPVIMFKGLGREGSRLKPEKARPGTSLPLFIETAREDLLFQTLGITGGSLPPGG